VALALAKARVAEAKPILIALIEREELRDQRGTLVHSLGYFDCTDRVGWLAGLVMSGNFEVAHEALEILDLIEVLDEEELEAVVASANRSLAAIDIEAWRRGLLDDLINMLS
jgi:hypothetical protein